ncbi:hypothetical protein ACFWIA_27335 [Streptomyces sp. NPDC127068]|uniref:hypothetical protein n=1 Tax=Streptomyces sp. NPDC127068 TaxID=3347127 RepID=UPI00365E3B4A
MTPRRPRWVWPLGALLAVNALLLVYVALSALERDEHADRSAPPPAPGRSPSPARTPTACAGANLDGVGAGLPAAAAREARKSWRSAVDPVYRAACDQDDPRLAALLEFEGSPEHFHTAPCPGCSSLEVVAMWRDEFLFDGADLARLLQTRPVLDQGGLTYRQADSVTWFARGTHDAPGQWSGLHPRCDLDDRCTDIT